MSQSSRSLLALAILLPILHAAPPDRVTRPVDARRSRPVAGSVHRKDLASYDQGAVDPALPLDYIQMYFRPSAAQQSDLDQLLLDQQNPSSPLFHKWLTPEEFGNRFGLSNSDHSKIVAWLTSEGFSVLETGRGRNWIAFKGTAAHVAKSLHTSLRRYKVDGEMHFSNSSEASVPEAFADVVDGFLGLDDFLPKPYVHVAGPEFNSGASHFLAPEDYSTIYNIGPLYKAGFDGTGQGIAIVGQSNILLSDIRTFRTRYGLPANDPRVIFYGGTDPGFNGAQLEGNLDLEWAGAIAPLSTITYVYGTNAFTAISVAVSSNFAPIISVSYGTCEVNASPPFFRSLGQQANAQGITILVASGDSGAAGCDLQGSEPLATRGQSVDFPAALPEVTAVGGTMFAEGSGNYWAASNSPNGGSALSYIPEAVWNESSTRGLLSSGGGASRFYSRPAWQTGPGVPNDNARHVPDMSLSAAGHDAYLVTYLGSLVAVSGTSASAPSMAGIVSLLNQYVVAKGIQKQAGLGNINPQLYRMAQTAPSPFHDTVAGDNIVQCSQASPDCLTGSFGYRAGFGYDMATGLGSIDANAFVTSWTAPANGVTVTLTSSAARGTINETVQLTAAVAGVAGSTGVPTGAIAFSANNSALGSATLAAGTGQSTATFSLPLYLLLATGTSTVTASYSGDSAFAPGGATVRIQVTVPTDAAGIIASGPSNVWPFTYDAQGPTWITTFTLREVAGVPALLTGFTIDGAAQTLSQFFPTTAIQPSSTLTATLTFRNLSPPLTRTFGFTGVDSTGANWSRQVTVSYFPTPTGQYSTLSATPLVVTQNTSADPSCQWSTQVNVDDQGGYLNVLTGLFVGEISKTSSLASVFGTTRIDAWGGLQGVVCFSNVTTPGASPIEVDFSSGLAQEVAVTFLGPPANPTKITATPATLSMHTDVLTPTVQTTLAVDIADKTQPWTARVFPANRTTSWLSLSQYSGVGPAQITVKGNHAGFEGGAYRATIVIQSPNAVPQYINVPVMLVAFGGFGTPSITSVVNAATSKPGLAPGSYAVVSGTQLAAAAATTTDSPLPYSLGGVTATVNGMPAALLSVSPTQINLQIPYSAGAGPAVLGIARDGFAGGLQFDLLPASPGIFLDANGDLAGSPTVKKGAQAALYATGMGEISPALKSAYQVPTGTSLGNMPRPLLPVSLTVGGVPAFLTFYGISPNLTIGVMQVNFIVPSSVPTGKQQVVLTVNGVSSPAGNITVQ